MKIGFTLDTLTSLSGKERVVYELAKRLVKKHEIILIMFEDKVNEKIKRIFEDLGVSFHFLKYGNAIKGRKEVFFKYREEITKLSLDVINTHGLILANAAALSKIPTVKTYHAHVTVLPELLSNPLRWADYFLEESISILFAKKISSISRYAKEQLKRFYFKDSELIYLGIDTKEFHPSKKLREAFKQKFKLSRKHEIIVGSVGRFTPQKNQQLLVRLSKKLGFHLLLVGSGYLEGYLRNLAKKLKAPVTFLKNLNENEIVGFYNTIDIYAHSSLWEGFGLPILEASACEKPTVAFDKTAMKEIIIHNATGFLAKNEKEFEKYLDVLINDEKVRKKLGKNAKKFANKFDWKTTAKKYENLFLEVENKFVG